MEASPSEAKTPKNIWEEVVYIAGLLRKFLYFLDVYEEAYEAANLRRILLTAAIGNVIAFSLTQIAVFSLNSYLIYRLGSSAFPIGLSNFIVDIFTLMMWIFILTISAFIMGYLIRLWYGEDEPASSKEWFGYTFIWILVKAVHLILSQPLAFLINQISIYNAPSFIPLIPVNFWYGTIIFYFLFGLYSYVILYRALYLMSNVGSSFFWRFLLIIILGEGLSYLFIVGWEFIIGFLPV